jgi:hypothetical protein
MPTNTGRLSEWRVGKVRTRSRGFGDGIWLEHMPFVTIRPDETVDDVAWQWARDHGYPEQDVRVDVVLD